MKKFWKFILTIIIAVAAYGYEAYDFGSEAHEAISLLQGQLDLWIQVIIKIVIYLFAD